MMESSKQHTDAPLKVLVLGSGHIRTEEKNEDGPDGALTRYGTGFILTKMVLYKGSPLPYCFIKAPFGFHAIILPASGEGKTCQHKLAGI